MDSVSPKLLANRAANKRWRDKNKERESLRFKAYRAAHLEELRRYGREHGKARYWADREAAKKRNQEQRAKHIQKRIASGRIYYAANAEKRRADAKAWYHAHKNDDHYKELRRKRDRAYQQKRRALKRGAAINLRQIREWMDRVRAKKTAVCYHCCRTVAASSVHFDHIVALSKGGPHSVENLCVSCEPCNRSKSNKPLKVWIRTGQQVLEL